MGEVRRKSPPVEGLGRRELRPRIAGGSGELTHDGFQEGEALPVRYTSRVSEGIGEGLMPYYDTSPAEMCSLAGHGPLSLGRVRVVILQAPPLRPLPLAAAVKGA
jgi:hypothetical protein